MDQLEDDYYQTEPISDDELSSDDEVEDPEDFKFDGKKIKIDNYNDDNQFFIKKGESKKSATKIYRFMSVRMLQVYNKDATKGSNIFVADRMKIRYDNTPTKDLDRIQVENLTDEAKPDNVIIRFIKVIK